MDCKTKRIFEFGAFSMDTCERTLSRDGAPVPLTPKAYEILLALVENRGRTLGKDELIERVWADTFVEVGNLNRNISTLRSVLGDDSHEPQFIKTMPKRGYRFEAEVREIIEEDTDHIVEHRVNNQLTTTNDEPTLLTRRSLTMISALAGTLFFVVLAWTLTSQPGDTRVNATSNAKNTEARELYQKGRALWQNRSGESLHQATLLLEQAVAADPNFALAHAALADAYAFDIQNRTKAEKTARRAIELDENLGEPRATLGFLKMFWDGNFVEAEAHFKQAVTLSPNYATAHEWYSINMAAIGRGSAALAEMKTALDLEPDSLPINADLCQILYFRQKFDEAETQCKRTLELDPQFLNANLYLYDIYSAKGMHDETVAQFFRIEELAPNHSAFAQDLVELKDAYKSGGIRAFWLTRVEMLKKLPATEYSIARYHARLGETDSVFEWLRKAQEKHDLNLLYFLAEPLFLNCCYSDPRYDELQGLLIGRKGRGY